MKMFKVGDLVKSKSDTGYPSPVYIIIEINSNEPFLCYWLYNIKSARRFKFSGYDLSRWYTHVTKEEF